MKLLKQKIDYYLRFLVETEKNTNQKVITKLTENYLKYYLVNLDSILNT